MPAKPAETHPDMLPGTATRRLSGQSVLGRASAPVATQPTPVETSPPVSVRPINPPLIPDAAPAKAPKPNRANKRVTVVMDRKMASDLTGIETLLEEKLGIRPNATEILVSMADILLHSRSVIETRPSASTFQTRPSNHDLEGRQAFQNQVSAFLHDAVRDAQSISTT
ncbi:MAG: hypothetical protein AAGD32_13755 [Planctomycetota bacterium]